MHRACEGDHQLETFALSVNLTDADDRLNHKVCLVGESTCGEKSQAPACLAKSSRLPAKSSVLSCSAGIDPSSIE
jgi:hypothetical protein